MRGLWCGFANVVLGLIGGRFGEDGAAVDDGFLAVLLASFLFDGKASLE